MIVILKPDCTEAQITALAELIREQGVDVDISKGRYQTVLGLLGDTGRIDGEFIASIECVESVKRVTRTFIGADRRSHPEDTVVQVGDVKIGGGHFGIIAGPCSVESEEQIMEVAMRFIRFFICFSEKYVKNMTKSLKKAIFSLLF